MSGGRLCRPRYWVMLCLLVLALGGCMLGQSSARDLGDASLEELMHVEVYGASKHLQRGARIRHRRHCGRHPQLRLPHSS
jgi:hypothetical protein